MGLMDDLLRYYDPGSAQSFLGQGAPGAPDFNAIMAQMQGLFDQTGDLFSEDNLDQMISAFLTGGTRDIASQTSAANRAVGSRASAAGMGGSFPVQQQVAGNFGQATNALAGLRGQVPGIENAFRNQQLGAINTQGSLLQGQGNLMNQDFENRFQRWDASRSGFENFWNTTMGWYAAGSPGHRAR